MIDDVQQSVLMAEFDIDDENLITAIQNSAYTRYRELNPTKYISPDQFIPEDKKPSWFSRLLCPDHVCDDDDVTPLEVTARLALRQKFPGLSLGHNDALLVNELSICLAGARPATIITEVEYQPDVAGREFPHCTVAEYTNLLAACFFLSNHRQSTKIRQDLESLGVPLDCLVYRMSNDINSAIIESGSVKPQHSSSPGKVSSVEISTPGSCSLDATAIVCNVDVLHADRVQIDDVAVMQTPNHTASTTVVAAAPSFTLDQFTSALRQMAPPGDAQLQPQQLMHGQHAVLGGRRKRRHDQYEDDDDAYGDHRSSRRADASGKRHHDSRRRQRRYEDNSDSYDAAVDSEDEYLEWRQHKRAKRITGRKKTRSPPR